ncbi:uncharacterized protein PHALS_05473 [Plasmopara halstedii]|uniref:BZIP domain-containing protein n=1 Tax=Plasmopara halstedii TaxID=4781 RepID=A0A0P1B1B8_PLAHL|nr:uncharacterized protein PHALS_05473 [Plasmopara halstedii]CEG47991.1 hypothetical protein PHALS_05473 [Plasmopara halstedii]|eukprot:XP_024584360.1 hypothetical protein PHALS_05473 [Plasmopara halstedii]
MASSFLLAFELPASHPQPYPKNWSDTDQQIFETLLLPSSSSSSFSDLSDSVTSIELKSTKKKTRSSRKRVTIEEKRIKHREVQRRFMQRKKAMLESAKKSIVTLEKQVAVLQLSNEREALAKEKRKLQLQADANAALPAATPTLDVLEMIFNQEGTAVEQLFQAFTVHQWQELLYQTLQSVDEIFTQEAMKASGMHVMGWSDRRHVENTSVKFTLHKTFPHVCAESIWNITWQRLTTDSYGSFFSPSLFIRKRLLQKVCDDAIIIYRVICYPQTGRVSRAIEVMSRVRRQSDFVYFIRTLDLPDVKERVCATDIWTQSLTVLRFMPSDLTRPQVGCTVQYGGNYVNIPKGGVRYWLMEVLFLVLRFEASLISPMFSLSN